MFLRCRREVLPRLIDVKPIITYLAIMFIDKILYMYPRFVMFLDESLSFHLSPTFQAGSLAESGAGHPHDGGLI